MASCKRTNEFAFRVAVAMDDLKSSHVYFVLQKAFGERLDWSEAEKLMQTIIDECRCLKCKRLEKAVKRNLKS